MSRQKMKIAPVDFINADCQGYLLKLDGRSKCWKTRFCLLSDAFLYLYVDKESESALGKYSITIWRLFFGHFWCKNWACTNHKRHEISENVWKTRFCLLRDAFLYLYVNKESESSLGKYSIAIWRFFLPFFLQIFQITTV